jgi:hypothetical protein
MGISLTYWFSLALSSPHRQKAATFYKSKIYSCPQDNAGLIGSLAILSSFQRIACAVIRFSRRERRTGT